MFWRLKIETQHERSTGSSTLLGIRGEKENKEKLLNSSSFHPNLNVPCEKVKVSLRKKNFTICC